MLIKNCQNNLETIIKIINQLFDNQYTKKLKVFGEVSIGEHIRHIVEFYQSVLHSNLETICYDKRKRNLNLSTDISHCIASIEELLLILKTNPKDFSITIETESGFLGSTFYRELFYALEHSIHHEALIKIGLTEIGMQNLMDENFGVAASTIKYKEQCAH